MMLDKIGQLKVQAKIIIAGNSKANILAITQQMQLTQKDK